jgi:hypothetical protein
MPIIKARSSSIINSVDLRGTPTAATAAQGTHTTQIATTNFVSSAVSDLINSAPAVLDTLAELASAINNDQSFASTVTGLIAEKVAKAGDTMTGFLTLNADPTDNLHAVTKQYVDGQINAQMIYSTDDLDEGSINLYYTNARVFGAITLSSDNTTVLDYNPTTGVFTYNHPNSDGILEGQTNKYFTQARARSSVSLTSDDNQILSYGSSTGVFTFTTPSTDKITEGAINIYFTTSRARNAISAGANINYDSATGIISSVAAVESVNGQTGVVVLDTDDISEGSSNLYFTNTRGRSAVSLTTDDSNILSYNTANGIFTFVTPSTDAIDEGLTNLYYTDARARNALSASGDISYNSATGNFSYSTPSTDGVNEGSTNLYFTNSRARSAISITTSNSDILSYDSTTGVITFELANQNTDQIAEGTNHLYFTTARARNAISVNSNWTNISYNSTTGVVTVNAPNTDDVTEGQTNLYFTTGRARNSVNAIDAGGDGSFSYDSTTGAFTYTGPSDSETRAHFSASTISGDGDLSYNSSTGAFSFAGPTNADYRQAVSGSHASGDGDFSYNSTTGVFTYTGPTNADYRQAVSGSHASGDGDFSYNSTTGVFTYTGPTNADYRGAVSVVHDPANGTTLGDDFTYDSSTGTFTYLSPLISELRGIVSATTASGVTYDYTTGIFSLANIPNSSLENSSITILGAPVSLGGSITFDTGDVNEGSNLYFTTARARNAISVNDPTGALSYDSTTGVISVDATVAVTSVNGYTGAVVLDTDDISEGTMNKYYTTARTRADVSGGTGVTYTQATGVFEIGQDVSTTSNVTFNDVVVAGDLTVQGTMTAIQSTTVEITDKNLTLAKGSANGAQADGAGLTIDGVGAHWEYKSATDSWESNIGVIVHGDAHVEQIFYGNDVRASTGFTGDLTGNVTGQVSDLSNHSTSDVSEGSNLYFTNSRARSAVSLTSDNTNVLSYNSSTGVFTFSLGNQTTDDVNEGSTNLYFTQERARNSVSATFAGGDGDFSYNSTNGVFTVTGPSDAETRAHFSASASGDGDLTYDPATGVFTYTGPSDSETRAHFSAVHASGDGNFSYDNSTGAFTYTGPTNADYRGAVSAVHASGDGNFSYDSTSGAFTYTGPSDSEVRAHFSAYTASGIEYTSSTGTFSLNQIPNSSLTNNSVTVNGAQVSLGGTTSFGTDSVSEETNLYFTNGRARSAISLTTSNSDILSYDSATGVITFELGNQNTDEIAEGLTNLYFTTARARDSISASGDLSYDSTTGIISYTHGNTDTVNEGSTNLYFTNSRARSAISLTTDNTDALSYDSTTGNFYFTLNSIYTDEIAEGAINLYFTTARARNTLSAGSNINYDSTTGIISTDAAVWSVNGQTHTVVLGTDDVNEGTTNLYFTNARAQGAISLTSDNTDILSYVSGTGVFTFVTPNTDAISEGATNLYYTNTRVTDLLANTSIDALSDVDLASGLQDGYSLVWSSLEQAFVPQNVTIQATNLNFTGDGTTTSFSTGVNVSSIDNTQVYVNGLIQAPTYSYTLSTVGDVTSIVFDAAPEANDYIMVKVVSSASLTAGGVLNEASRIDGGTF